MAAKNFKRFVGPRGITNLIGSNGTYNINTEGIITTPNGEEITYKLDQDGYRVVTVTSWNGYRDYRIVDLMVLQYKDIHIPIIDYDKVEGFHADSDQNNLDVTNIGYRFKGGKLEHRDFEGYYYVPSLTRVIISEEGSSYKLLNNEWVPVKYNRKPGTCGDYLRIFSKFHGKTISMGRHRALCLVFRPYPNDVDEIEVNHIDGIPGNDDLSNLEWVTKSQNSLHAVSIGRNNKNDEVLVRNVYTGEVTEYFSMNECSKQLGTISAATIWRRIYEAPFSQIFHDGIQLKLKTDNREWVIPNDIGEALDAARSVLIPVKLKDSITNQVTKYETVSEACRLLDVVDDTIIRAVTNGTMINGYFAKYLDDYTPWPVYTEKDYILSFCKGLTPVSARNVLTGETKEFASIAAAVRMVPITIMKSLRDGKQPLYSNGWQLKYPWDEWEEVINPKETCYRLTKEISCKNELTNKIIVASNTKELVGFLGWSKGMCNLVRELALTRGNKIYRGYRFRLGITNDPWPTNK